MVESDLKLPIFVVQRAAIPQNWVEFHQKSIGAIRCSGATLYVDVWCCATSVHLLTNQKFVLGGWAVGGGCGCTIHFKDHCFPDQAASWSISMAMMHWFPNHLKLINHHIEIVALNTINSMNLKKWVKTFLPSEIIHSHFFHEKSSNTSLESPATPHFLQNPNGC